MVVLILTLVIFGFGIKFAYDLLKSANDLSSMSQEDLDAKIGELLCESNERFCFGEQRKTIESGDMDVFGVKILNILGNKYSFTTTVTRGIYINKDGVSETTQTPSTLTIMPETTETDIPNFEDRTITIGVQVNEGSPGTYVLDVEIICDSGTDDCSPYGKGKLYIEAP